MTYLVDTNTLSELGRPRPDQGVLSWFDAVPDELIHISVITLGEFRRGIQLLPQGGKRSALEASLLDIQADYSERILPVDEQVALLWGDISAAHRRRGVNPGITDELMAATALRWDFVVVTRSIADFETAGCRLLSPWTD